MERHLSNIVTCHVAGSTVARRRVSARTAYLLGQIPAQEGGASDAEVIATEAQEQQRELVHGVELDAEGQVAEVAR